MTCSHTIEPWNGDPERQCPTVASYLWITQKGERPLCVKHSKLANYRNNPCGVLRKISEKKNTTRLTRYAKA